MSLTQSSRFVFESAGETDGQELLAILEEAAFKGNISLLYTRRPDAYRSFMQEAKDVQILLARDTKDHKIAGFGACALRELFVNGKPAKVGYLFSLRMARSYQKKTPILHRGYQALHARHQGEQVACFLTTVLEENQYARKLLEKPRRCLPAYIPLGGYEVFAMPCRRRSRRSKSGRDGALVFRCATSGDTEELAKFLNRQGRRVQFFPVVHADELQNGRLYGLATSDFHLLHARDGEILAAGAVWDQRHYKQYLVQGYGGVFKFLRPLSRILPLLGYPALPAAGSVLAFFTLSFWGIKENKPQIFERFLDEFTQVSGQHSFFLVGLHERHPLYPSVQKRRHISYRSQVYRVAWPEDGPNAALLDRNAPPYLECGLL